MTKQQFNVRLEEETLVTMEMVLSYYRYKGIRLSQADLVTMLFNEKWESIMQEKEEGVEHGETRTLGADGLIAFKN